MATASGSGRPLAEEPTFRLERSEAAAAAVMPVELAAEQAAEDLLELYTDSIERVQKALQELRRAQLLAVARTGRRCGLVSGFVLEIYSSIYSFFGRCFCLHLQGSAAKGGNGAGGGEGELKAGACSRGIPKSCAHPATGLGAQRLPLPVLGIFLKIILYEHLPTAPLADYRVRLIARSKHARLIFSSLHFLQLEQLPDYIATAQAAAREMRALRSRVDRSQQRSAPIPTPPALSFPAQPLTPFPCVGAACGDQEA